MEYFAKIWKARFLKKKDESGSYSDVCTILRSNTTGQRQNAILDVIEVKILHLPIRQRVNHGLDSLISTIPCTRTQAGQLRDYFLPFLYRNNLHTNIIPRELRIRSLAILLPTYPIQAPAYNPEYDKCRQKKSYKCPVPRWFLCLDSQDCTLNIYYSDVEEKALLAQDSDSDSTTMDGLFL